MIVSNLLHILLAFLLYVALNIACVCIHYTASHGFKAAWKALVTAKPGQVWNCFARSYDSGSLYLFVAVLIAGNWVASPTGTWVIPCTVTASVFLWQHTVINGMPQRTFSYVMSGVTQAIAIKQQLACWASFVAWSALAWFIGCLIILLAFTRYART
jgi:hypothetical protein